MIRAVEPDDFIHEMYVAVGEECPLWELPLGATDLLPDRPVVHGPWEPADCSALMLRWSENGWLELYLPNPPSGRDVQREDWLSRVERRDFFLILAVDDARAC